MLATGARCRVCVHCLELICVFLWHRCWLSVDNHFIWSFIGPVTCIIMVSCFLFFEYSYWQSEEGTERVRWKRCRGKIKGSRMVELTGKVSRIFAPSLPGDDRLILRHRQITRRPTFPSAWQGSASIAYFNLTFTLFQEVSYHRYYLMTFKVMLTIVWNGPFYSSVASRGNVHIFFVFVCLQIADDFVRKKESESIPSVWSGSAKGEGHIAYNIDICPIEACNYLLVMTLLSLAPSERLRRIRPSGVLLPCAGQKKKK